MKLSDQITTNDWSTPDTVSSDPRIPPPPQANVTCLGDATYVSALGELQGRIHTACLYLDRLRLRGGANARQLAKVRHFLQTGEKQW